MRGFVASSKDTLELRLEQLVFQKLEVVNRVCTTLESVPRVGDVGVSVKPANTVP